MLTLFSNIVARSANKFEFGSGSSQCLENVLVDLPVTKDNLYVNAHSYSFNG